MKQKIKITIPFLLSHLFAYLFVSIPYYQAVMKEFYEGDHAVFPKFLLTQANGEAWNQAMSYLFPSLLLQGLLMAVFFLFLWDWFVQQSLAKQFLILVWSRSVMGGIASISPAVGNLEGFVFLTRDVTFKIHTLVVLEILLQSLVFSFFFLKAVGWMFPKRSDKGVL